MAAFVRGPDRSPSGSQTVCFADGEVRGGWHVLFQTVWGSLGERSGPGILAIILFLGLAPSARSAPPVNVVLVHGFWNTGRIFDPLVATLEQHGCRCFAPSLRPNDFRLGARDLALKLSGDIDARFGPREPFVLVGFSMGGLVSRDYVQNLGHGGRVRALFLISTANQGTLWAALSPWHGVRELAPGSGFLRQLNADPSAWKGIPVHAYWTPFDFVVFPATNSRCAFGDTRAVFCLLHPLMPSQHEIMADIAAKIDALPAAHVPPFAGHESAR